MAYQEVLHAIDGATATTTSSEINIEDAKKITIVCKRSNHSAGSTAFSVTVSPDGTNYTTYNKLINNLANSNVQDLTRSASITLSSDTVTFVSLDCCDAFKTMKVTATETTDGTHDAWVIIQR